MACNKLRWADVHTWGHLLGLISLISNFSGYLLILVKREWRGGKDKVVTSPHWLTPTLVFSSLASSSTPLVHHSPCYIRMHYCVSWHWQQGSAYLLIKWTSLLVFVGNGAHGAQWEKHNLDKPVVWTIHYHTNRNSILTDFNLNSIMLYLSWL